MTPYNVFMDTVDDFLKREYEKVIPSFSIPDNPASFQSWKESVRKELSRKLCIDEKPSFGDVSVISEEDCGSYVRKRMAFSMNGLVCPFYLLVPKEKPAALVLALHGHGVGVKDAIGLCEEESYQKKFALRLCEEGFAVVAPELLGFGDMRLNEDNENDDSNSCHRLAMNLLFEGKTLLGMRVQEARCSLTIASSMFPSLRRGVMGISGGGTVATFLTALSDDISAAVISGYAGFFRTSILAMHHCVCNYVPGLLQSFELPTILSSIAPVPMLWESGDKDPIYPQKAAEEASVIVGKCYRLLGHEEAFSCDFFSGEHEIHGVKAYRFLKDNLR